MGSVSGGEVRLMRGEVNRHGMRGWPRKERRGEGSLLISPCSRNARPPKALVGRAQGETKQTTLPEEKTG